MIAPENFEHDTLPDATCNTQLEFIGRGPQLGALPCDAYHHFYHYQASTQYTLLARICLALGLADEAQTAITKALFQDHFNAEALALKAGGAAEQDYNKHPMLDAEFHASIGEQPEAATQLHDSAMQMLKVGEFGKADMLLLTAISVTPEHSNSHFALAKIAFHQKDYEGAKAHVHEAIRLSHLAHDAYHRSASQEHLARGREFAARGERDLAINDFTKALDLHRGNTQATEECERLRKA